MKVYKTVNVNRGNLKDKFVDENKINDMAKEGWTLVNITVPPNAENNKHVIGVFVRDQATVQVPNEKVEPVPVETPKRGPGRPSKFAVDIPKE
jgi:hypothetical protein